VTPTQDTRSSSGDARPQRGARILVVDDDPHLLKALRITLAAHGYDVAVAENGASALVAAGSNVPDVVVLDLGLPDMEGVQVLGDLRRWTSGWTNSWPGCVP
jgi:two-component system KDP operon response regulator KdpE